MKEESISEFYNDVTHKSATIRVNLESGKYCVRYYSEAEFSSLEDAENQAEDWVMKND